MDRGSKKVVGNSKKKLAEIELMIVNLQSVALKVLEVEKVNKLTPNESTLEHVGKVKISFF